MTAQPQLQQTPPPPAPMRCGPLAPRRPRRRSLPLPVHLCPRRDLALRDRAGEPAFSVVFHSDAVLGKRLDEYAISRAYVEGQIEIEGDVLAFLDLRHYVKGRFSLGFLLRAYLQLLSGATASTSTALPSHTTTISATISTWRSSIASTTPLLALPLPQRRRDPSNRPPSTNLPPWPAPCACKRVPACSTLAPAGVPLPATLAHATSTARALTHCRGLAPAASRPSSPTKGWRPAKFASKTLLAHEPPEPYGRHRHLRRHRAHPPLPRFCRASVEVPQARGPHLSRTPRPTLEKYKVSNFVRRYIYPRHPHVPVPARPAARVPHARLQGGGSGR